MEWSLYEQSARLYVNKSAGKLLHFQKCDWKNLTVIKNVIGSVFSQRVSHWLTRRFIEYAGSNIEQISNKYRTNTEASSKYRNIEHILNKLQNCYHCMYLRSSILNFWRSVTTSWSCKIEFSAIIYFDFSFFKSNGFLHSLYWTILKTLVKITDVAVNSMSNCCLVLLSNAMVPP